MLQAVVVTLCLALSLGYAWRRIRQATAASGDPCQGCTGCAMKELAAEKGQKRQKHECIGKKDCEKFGRNKKND